MFSPSRLHWPSHIRTTPPELGERDLIVYHLGTITRWANIPYGCHGNVLLGRGWSVCQRQFLVVATLLQHPEWWKTQKQYVLYFFFFYSSILWRCFGFFWKVGGKEDAISGDGNNEETKRVEQVILKLMRKWRVGRQRGRDRKRNQIILCALLATKTARGR